MPDPNARWLWYEKPAFVIAAIVIFWPVGVALMWSQRKFSYRTRRTVTAVAALVTVVAVFAVLPPLKGTIGAPATSATMTAQPVFGTGGGVPVPPMPVATQTASLPTSTSPTGEATSTSPTTPGGSAAPPAGYTPVSGPAQAHFTMEGTYTQTEVGSTVAFTLTAEPAADIVSWDWWVTASGSTSQYTGSMVQDSYSGMPPTSVKLITTDSSGRSYQSQAGVVTTDGRVYAAVR